MILILIPATLILFWHFGDRKYYLCSLLLIIYSMIPFFLSFEKRKPQARELVSIAVMCAIAVVSRAAFMMLPHFKPMLGIIMITGMAFGAEAGFLTGALGALSATFCSDRVRGLHGRCSDTASADFWQDCLPAKGS